MPNKVYQHDETPVTFKSSAGTEVWTPTSLATNTGRQSTLHDFGTSARARRGNLRVSFKTNGTSVVGERVEIYLKTSDGTNPDNADTPGTTDGAVSAQDKLRNLKPVGVIQIDKANTSDVQTGSWDLEIPARFAGVVMWNATANTLSGTAGDFSAVWTPTPDEVQ